MKIVLILEGNFLKKKYSLGAIIIAIILAIATNYMKEQEPTKTTNVSNEVKQAEIIKNPKKNIDNLSQLSNYDGQHVVITIHQNQPTFSQAELSLANGSWQRFSELDTKNRVGQADAMLGYDLMPRKKREDISKVYPTGWRQKKMSNGEFIYNRSHLIAHQLTGENANWKNLFTGTEIMNQEYMTQYEQPVADYIKRTKHHVRYQVKPIFMGDELVCRGVQMQAKSIEDDQISYNVFIYNVEPGYTINYLTGQATKAN